MKPPKMGSHFLSARHSPSEKYRGQQPTPYQSFLSNISELFNRPDIKKLLIIDFYDIF